MKLADLKNLGRVTERQLLEVGIHTPEELETVGSLEAYRRLKERYPREITRVALYTLEGALLDLHWNQLPPDVKARLIEEAST